ncbi:LysR family transcriptional regulator [Burkholderia sp. Bp9004]|uniref:LysR family transcriptional regulator n=1 Tax=Burkholderia sp. Bp9004 TaxID=2184559 RepID=UPI000F6000BE|nr:LysR family transcriptional regulator [Burkholderia sp. Bp9004]RQZ59992.1 LysR family transcriptional regulator [Burkholderia sp. Bp9004]
MNSVENFRAFLAVVESGSFSNAARRLSLSASVITKRIGAVEEEVGELLFVRSTRRLELTATGREMIPLAREFLSSYERIVNVTAHGTRELSGSLRIKAPISFTVHFIGEVLNEFLLEHPKINIDLQLTNRPVNPLTENLDMVITGLPTSFDGVDELPLCPFRRIVCAAPSYLERMGEPIHPSDLQNHRCLLYSYVEPARVWMFKSAQAGNIDVSVNGQFHSNDIEAMHCAAVSGLGIAILPRYRAQASLQKGELVEILGLYELPDLWIKIQRPSHHNKSLLLARLTDHLVSRVQHIKERHPSL